MSGSQLRGFLDESWANRGVNRQEYFVCAALIPATECDDAREQLRRLRLPGQVKVHWTAESDRRRRDIVARIVELGPMNVVVSHLSERQNKVERFRRKCLESLYYELVDAEIFDLTLESRSRSQDGDDRAHLVAMQAQRFDIRLRVRHQRGGDEPLLWIADAVLGAINAAHLGESQHLSALEETIILTRSTPESLVAVRSEGP